MENPSPSLTGFLWPRGRPPLDSWPAGFGLDQHFAEPALGIELQLGGVGDHAAILGLARVQFEALRLVAHLDHLVDAARHGRQTRLLP